ncbi:hypothetical protein GUITHDRAFT_159794 [Guillardia theta CCMP2712]|uniref:Rho GDP-dissociation inhibitor n=1 Tax=Guillardia theta (strain CCMP2712) TaxID=905079 RepID=L1J5S2_GUITC|nr:hypothetical protein GUITHDRAFT_159794 [Guillardia theta CCMP2712]EKX43430.1 hypothetical protein GUITHDRAFT_159794 [Guillardia theta CCMP2712]|eukprot:XP_005830410.1 hypothetical protein GUITHDRAFT_159794 [Guillardia theta CCMP2712]
MYCELSNIASHSWLQASNEDDDDKPNDGYKVPEKVGVQELLAKDQNDESLRRYKEQLLGAAAKGQLAVDPNDKRRVVITELKILFEDRPGGDITYTLNTPQDVKAMKSKPFVLKEKCNYKIQISFRVQHEIVSGLKYINKVYKAGLRLRKDEEMLGSYAPQPQPYVVTIPRQTWEEAPSGWFARGGFTANSSFADDDGVKHLEYEYAFEIKSGWS